MKTRGFHGPVQQMTCVLLLGRQLGGLKTSPYAAFCIREINDGATVGISVLKTLSANRERFPKIWLSLQMPHVSLGPVNWDQLFKGPYSTPFRRPPDADSHIRQLVKDTLPEETENIKIKALLGADAELQEMALIDS